MDATVDDFLNEINEIVPLKENTGAWQECFDEQSGFHYYWNTKTDKVTWSKPDEYIPMNKSLKTNILPNRPQIPFEKANKIYKIGQTNLPVVVADLSKKNKKKSKPQTNKEISQCKRPVSDSEDEKIVLISSYGEDTDSENDEEPVSKLKLPNKKNPQSSFSNESKPEIVQPSHSKENPIGGFSLVAGYSDSEDDENEEVKSIFPIQQPIIESKVSHSTLFPITKPIDVKDFLNTPHVEEKPEQETKAENELVDTKAFQRKRRIGISLVNNIKKPKEENEEDEGEKKGFGSSANEKKESVYAGFKKGGVMFVKSDDLPGSKLEITKTQENPKEKNSESDQKHVVNLYNVLKGKLTFLNEGRPEVSPVQIMLIQAETLFLAMAEEGLLTSYFNKWLSDTCADLIKLETEAAPKGWTLKWDRSHMRYFYENHSTGEGQWEYPQPDVVRCDEAMDISTTPPPEDEVEQPVMAVMAPVEPPLPPMIRDPTPPPPPIISGPSEEKRTEVKPCDVPLPPGPSCNKLTTDSQPLPPGVDLLEEPIPEKKTDSTADTSLTTALDSFYSDIAAIDHSNSPPVPLEETQPENNGACLDSTKKKKKSKVKLGPGLAMKKKGVSKLVEKWKNVQMGYDK
ncbi:unnamed protein product [Brassicogethes aeneus]|uniref:WW domain-containing protein n=1 Tax=Brassicogethes aeneus TaxID=1431903 RepID=A0A9P0BBU6_BRAAE|nr:unnamed protein product [Brassicogethes aeneus]